MRREGVLKLLSGWRMPQGQGLEFAGVIEQVGRGVTGDAVCEVFGDVYVQTAAAKYPGKRVVMKD
jgi:NADPH:quinone reductase-like Zn-dependent oxidoreductase